MTSQSTTTDPAAPRSETLDRAPEILETLTDCASSIAKHHEVPVEAVLIHSLSIASALASAFVSSQVAGPAILPLLVRAPGVPPPDWMSQEWQALERHDDLANRPNILDHPSARAAQRRKARIMGLLDPDSMMNQQFLAGIKSRRLCFGRVAVTHGTGRLATATNSVPLTHLSASLQRVRAVLSRLASGQKNESLLGCIDEQEFRALVRNYGGFQLTAKTGLVLPLSKSVPDDRTRPAPALMTDLLHRTLIDMRQGKPPFVLRPDPEVTRIIDRHSQRRESVRQSLPEAVLPLLPDPARVWHMTALLASLCNTADQPEASGAAARLASALDQWATHRHLHIMRLACPADHQGLFDSTSLAVFRQLGTMPQTVREIQRCLRGTNKDQCLRSLQRAVDAGLALELPGKTYQLPPGPGCGLSETDGENPAHPPSQDPAAAQSTENTEKT